MAMVNNGVGTVEITGTISGNVASAIFPAACYTEGVHECFMRITKAADSSEAITALMHLNVAASETDNPLDPGTEIITTLSGLLANEASRVSAEFGRASAETARVAAENARSVNVTNLITGGNFPNTGGISATNVTMTASDNKLRLVANGTGEHYGEKEQSSVFTAGHVYYARVKVSGIIGKAKFEMFNRKADGNFESAESVLSQNGCASIVLPVTTKYSSPYAALRMRVMNAAGSLSFTASSEEASWEYLFMIDLTALFNAGNEPTAVQMDAYMVLFSNGWFDGASNIAAPRVLFPATFAAYKAFVPGAWITPTMLNGATASGLGYRKNAFGVVEFHGSFTPASTGVSAFTLPDGYRPPNGTTFALINTLAQVMSVGVYSDGRVVPWTASTSGIACDGMRVITT
jgi:hypothetical protein